jgi:hypothetical protein
MNEPTRMERYVSLVVSDALDKDQYQGWYRCVAKYAPYGVVSTFQSIDTDNEPRSVLMVHRETKDSHYYMVPITRDLTDKEASRIVDAWAEQCEHMDFDIEATVIPSSGMSKPSGEIEIDDEKYAELAVSWAKRKHEEWLRERTKDGWRYGLYVDLELKTHPLLRPWDELPERYRNVDLDQPQKLIDLMGEHGYTVVSKKDLESVQRMLRGL